MNREPHPWRYNPWECKSWFDTWCPTYTSDRDNFGWADRLCPPELPVFGEKEHIP
jgi:hypothetical protein